MLKTSHLRTTTWFACDHVAGVGGSFKTCSTIGEARGNSTASCFLSTYDIHWHDDASNTANVGRLWRHTSGI